MAFCLIIYKDDAHRTSYKWFILPIVKVKDYNVLSDRRKFFDQPLKTDLRTYGGQYLYVYRQIYMDNIKKIWQVKEMIIQLVVC